MTECPEIYVPLHRHIALMGFDRHNLEAFGFVQGVNLDNSLAYLNDEGRSLLVVIYALCIDKPKSVSQLCYLICKAVESLSPRCKGHIGSHFLLCLNNNIQSASLSRRCLKTYCVMALYLCLKSSCENAQNPISVPCENETATCPKCGATMMRLDLIQKQGQNQKEGGEK